MMVMKVGLLCGKRGEAIQTGAFGPGCTQGFAVVHGIAVFFLKVPASPGSNHDSVLAIVVVIVAIVAIATRLVMLALRATFSVTFNVAINPPLHSSINTPINASIDSCIDACIHGPARLETGERSSLPLRRDGLQKCGCFGT